MAVKNPGKKLKPSYEQLRNRAKVRAAQERKRRRREERKAAEAEA